jgi:hypothetical protein
VLAGAGQMDRLIAMQIKKRRGGQQFQMQSSKYISFDVPTTAIEVSIDQISKRSAL